MLSFDPPELLERLNAARAVLDDFLDWDWYSTDAPDFDPAEYDDIVVSEGTCIEPLRLAHSRDEWLEPTVAEYLEWAKLLSSGELIDRTELRLGNRTMVLVRPESMTAHGFVYAPELHDGFVVSASYELSPGKELEAQLNAGVTIFALFVAREGGCDEDTCPPGSEEDHFVDVRHPSGTDPSVVAAFVDAFLFELSTSHALDFARARYPESFEGWEEPDYEFEHVAGSTTRRLRLRPIQMGDGLGDLHRLYVKAAASPDQEYRLITLVKIIEYVSVTVVKQQAHEAVRRRLHSRAALRADASFIESLLETAEEQRAFRKDAEALKLTVVTCCDPTDLSPLAPPSIRTLGALTKASTAKERKAALAELSSCLSATRNQLAHAKANYRLAGDEIPDAELEQLTECARIAAEQVIRWYATLAENLRIAAQ
ncbi:hypothetical protein OAX78_01220 [Planctomycetota bacterium]|nr:hypothetical protein [Planctomycetota bacterium]